MKRFLGINDLLKVMGMEKGIGFSLREFKLFRIFQEA